MTATMTAVETKKYPNLQLVQGNPNAGQRLVLRGRRRGRRTKTAAELVLQRWVREEFNALTDPNGNRPSEAIQKICQDEQFPLNYFGRRMIEAHSAGVAHAQARQLWERVGLWIDKLFETPARAPEAVSERVFYQGPRLCA